MTRKIDYPIVKIDKMLAKIFIDVALKKFWLLLY